ncbi:tryptophan synthase subunit alpha [Buchnera aphidicola]|uniref:tryptophan synthase subunit alpha n=1 Tax=Buchnera aphidicola TaxID=9 RepID=UPI00094D9D7A|nr:tryptophan synthase subunit alpha [Buchnera aphidicola]
MKSRYKLLFHNLYLKKEYCFIPFVVLGDPNIKISLQIIDILINNGADALELGIPFSDPIADGIIIQNAHTRALKHNITVKDCFNMINIIRKKYPHIPIGLLTYSNVVFNKKLSDFYSLCRSSGVDSVLIADLPLEESSIFQEMAQKNNISSIFICPPNADNQFLQKIIQLNPSYIYLVSRPGITGKQKIFPHNTWLKKVIRKLKQYQSPPIIQGFGIHRAHQIKNILKNGIHGIICGSCIVQIIEKSLLDTSKMFSRMKKLVIEFKNETKNNL